MPFLHGLATALRRLVAPLRRRALERDMDEEMRFHVEMEAGELHQRGLPADAARRQALAAFGGVARFKEEGHEARGSHWLGDFAQDLRYTRRSLGHHRGYATIAIVTLALGIGVTTTIFGVVHGVLLKPMPYRAPEQLLLVWDDLTVVGVPEAWVTGPEIVRLRAEARLFEGFAAVAARSLGLSDASGESEQLSLVAGSSNLFDLLGSHPVRGRGFVAGEDRPGAPLVMVISDGLWRRRFGADPSVVGRTVQLDSTPATIVGVLPPQHQFAMQFSLGTPATVDGYIPLRVDLGSEPVIGHRYGVLARVRDGVSVAAAREELRAIGTRIDAATYGGNHRFQFAPVALQERLVREVRPALLLLMGAVSLLVLIMAANLATLALARATRRQREFAVRRALGATPGRLTRQVMTETVVISLAGAVVGVLLARWGIKALLALAPEGLPRRAEIGVDPMVVAFTLGLGLLVGITVALAPLRLSLRRDISAVTRDRGSSGAPGMRTRGALVLGQMALSLVLLAGTALLLTSFVRLLGVEPGFDARGVLGVTLRANPARVPNDRVAGFARAYLERLKALPGVTSVGATSAPPLSAAADQYNALFVDARGLTGDRRKDTELVDWMVATPGYFRTMGVRLTRGREFTDADRADGPPVAIVDERLARRYFPNGDAVGHQLRVIGDTLATVVGIVPQVRLYNIQEESRPQVYRPHAQQPSREITFVMRTAREPETLATAARSALSAIEPAQAIIAVDPMTSVVEQSLAERRLVLVLVAAFAATALFLAALGVYGVTSAAVAQRTRELGIRLALGADARALVWLTLRKPMAFVATGVVAGVAGALFTSRLIRGLLYQVSPSDPALLALVAAGLVGTALVASYLPARRATRVDPARVLQAE